MKRLEFGQFMRKSLPGFLALLPVWLMVVIGYVSSSGDIKTFNDSADRVNADSIARWRGTTHEVELQHFTMQVLNDVEHVEYKNPHAEAYVNFMSTLVHERTADNRKQALLKVLGTKEISDQLCVGLHRAIIEEGLSATARIALSRGCMPNSAGFLESDQRLVENVAFNYVNYAQHGLDMRLPDFPSKPLMLQHQHDELIDWVIFLAIVLSLQQLLAGLFFHDFGRTNKWEFEWVLPVNPGSWLVLLVFFAPAFFVPWITYGIYRVLLRPIGFVVWTVLRVCKWTLVDFDLSKPGRRLSTWLAERKETKQRTQAEDRLRMAELAIVGGDVMSARAKLEQTRALIGNLPKKAQKSYAQTLREMSETLERVAEQRRKTTRVGSSQGSVANVDRMLDELSNQIEGLDEAEGVVSPSV